MQSPCKKISGTSSMYNSQKLHKSAPARTADFINAPFIHYYSSAFYLLPAIGMSKTGTRNWWHIDLFLVLVVWSVCHRLKLYRTTQVLWYKPRPASHDARTCRRVWNVPDDHPPTNRQLLNKAIIESRLHPGVQITTSMNHVTAKCVTPSPAAAESSRQTTSARPC